ncbi:MAG: glucose-1-phosphate cytidylyltransferase [Acidobacteria bacterium]|nr:glucose-1-phosphate cytidylyltransferase [Acidobacteriota bacterium]
MKVVILCGGQGTRLREETEYRPKPLVEIGGKPILWHIMKGYAHHGYEDFALCLGYRGHMIKEYFLNYEAMNNDFTISLGQKSRIDFNDAHKEQNFRVTLAETGQETMTGGRIKRVERYVDGDTFFVTYGDGLADVNITKLLEFHRSHGRAATVTAVRPQSRFGILETASDGKVLQFSEKPQVDGWANAGFFVFERKVFDYLDADEGCILERKPLERLAAEGELMAYHHEGFFFAMDTYREYLYLNQLWKSGEAPWKVWSQPLEETR